jgi:hypothetical protein
LARQGQRTDASRRLGAGRQREGCATGGANGRQEGHETAKTNASIAAQCPDEPAARQIGATRRVPMVTAELVPIDHVHRAILLIRGHKVLLDVHLADLYGVSAKALNQAVKRNMERFPIDFMFQLTLEEARRLRSQIVTLRLEAPDITADSSGDGRVPHGKHIKYLPYAFTEQGVAMLSSVLRSPRAIQVNIEIIRAFVRLRQLLQSNVDLAKKLAAIEKRYDARFRVVFDAIRELMAPPTQPTRRIGFRRPEI